MRFKSSFKPIVLTVFLVIVSITPALAQSYTAEVIQNLQSSFQTQTSAWFGPLENIAVKILFALATISYVWSAIQLVLKNADLQEFVVELVRLVMFTGFFLALTLNAEAWSTALIDGFMWAGNQAASGSVVNNIGPASILERGFVLSGNIINASSTLTYLAYFLAACITILFYGLIAAYMLLVYAEAYIVTAAGVLLLGFGGSQWTADYAKKYITYCVSVGAKLYVISLVVGLGERFIYDWAIVQDKSQAETLLAIIGVLLMLMLLVKMIPDIVQGIINGSSLGHHTPTIGGIAATTAGVVTGAAASSAGNLAALREATKLTEAQFASGNGGSPFGSEGNFGGGTGNRNGSTLKMPNSQGASFGKKLTKTAQNLGNAAVATIGAKARGEIGTKNTTFGGAMAQHLRAERMGTPPQTTFDTQGTQSMSGTLSGDREKSDKEGITD